MVSSAVRQPLPPPFSGGDHPHPARALCPRRPLVPWRSRAVVRVAASRGGEVVLLSQTALPRVPAPPPSPRAASGTWTNALKAVRYGWWPPQRWCGCPLPPERPCGSVPGAPRGGEGQAVPAGHLAVSVCDHGCRLRGSRRRQTL